MLGVMGIWQSNEQSATDDESVCGDVRFHQIPSPLTPFPVDSLAIPASSSDTNPLN